MISFLQISSSTESPLDLGEIPQTPLAREDPKGSEPGTTQEDKLDPVPQKRVINDEDLYNKEIEELTKKSPGFAKTVLISLEEQTKTVIEKVN